LHDAAGVVLEGALEANHYLQRHTAA
jgi:hypothetical protein